MKTSKLIRTVADPLAMPRLPPVPERTPLRWTGKEYVPARVTKKDGVAEAAAVLQSIGVKIEETDDGFIVSTAGKSERVDNLAEAVSVGKQVAKDRKGRYA